MKKPRSCCYCGNIPERKRFLSITAVDSVVCEVVVLIATSGNALFPLKKRYSPSIFQKEMLDKRFTNRVNTTLTKNVTVHGFTVGQPVGGDVTGLSVRWQRARGAGVVKAFRSCLFPTQFSEGAGRFVAHAGRCNPGHDSAKQGPGYRFKGRLVGMAWRRRQIAARRRQTNERSCTKFCTRPTQ
jgi:hypothetical protein